MRAIPARGRTVSAAALLVVAAGCAALAAEGSGGPPAPAGEEPAPDSTLAACFPRGEAIPGWRLVEEPEVFPAEDLWRHIDGAAEQYLSYGCVALAVGYYRQDAAGETAAASTAPSGAPASAAAAASATAAELAAGPAADAAEVMVEVYQTEDPRGSFGLYALERPATGTLLAIGAQGIRAGGEVLFFGGPFYAKARAYPEDEVTSAAAVSLARAIAEAHLAPSAFPAEVDLFPRHPQMPVDFGFLPRSTLGLSAMRDAFVARYSGETGELVLHFSRLGDAVAAEEMYAALREEIASRGVRPPEEVSLAGAHGVLGGLMYHGPVLALRREGDVILASGAIESGWGRGLIEALLETLAR